VKLWTDRPVEPISIQQSVQRQPLQVGEKRNIGHVVEIMTAPNASGIQEYVVHYADGMVTYTGHWEDVLDAFGDL